MRRAFTVVELIVASVVGAMLAGATVSVIAQMLRVRAHAAGRQQAFARSEGVASQAALDVAAAARDYDLYNAKVEILSAGLPGQEADELIVLTRSMRRVYAERDGPEGDTYEAQYRLVPGPGGVGVVWRRVDAGLDPYLDAGGIASPLAHGVRSLSFQAYDGTKWLDAWDSDTSGLPHAVRVVVVATSDDGRVLATSRRVVAIDRVPVIPEAMQQANDARSDDTSSAAGGTGGQAR